MVCLADRYDRTMKSLVSLSLIALVAVVSACAPPTENAERSAACKEAGNQRMCGVCCKTKSSTFTTTGTTGSCACFGDLEK
jgi:hypothetical protein